MRVRRLLGNRERDHELPQLQPLRVRPSLNRIVAVVAERFGCEADEWASGRRSDAIGRAAAAYLARRRYGYTSTEIAEFLGYRGHSSVGAAVARIEAVGNGIDATLAKLEEQLANA